MQSSPRFTKTARDTFISPASMSKNRFGPLRNRIDPTAQNHEPCHRNQTLLDSTSSVDGLDRTFRRPSAQFTETGCPDFPGNDSSLLPWGMAIPAMVGGHDIPKVFSCGTGSRAWFSPGTKASGACGWQATLRFRPMNLRPCGRMANLSGGFPWRRIAADLGPAFQ